MGKKKILLEMQQDMLLFGRMCMPMMFSENSPNFHYDITKYLYCEKTKTPAYSGSYGQQPALWLEKFFVIDNAMIMRKNRQTEKFNQDRKKANG